MADIGHLPIPNFHRSPQAAIGTAKNLDEQGEFANIVIAGEAPDGCIVFLSAASGRELTLSEALFILERAKMLVMMPDRYTKEQ